MIVASTIVPVLTVTPWARRCSVTVSNRAWPRPCASNRWRNLQTVVSSGTGSCPRSMPTNARIVGESYSASSTAGSERLNQCWRKYIRSYALQSDGWSAVPGLRVHGFDAPTQLAPRHHAIHLGEELRSSRELRVLLEPAAGQRPLRTRHRHLLFSRDAARGITAQLGRERETYSEIP